MEVLGCNGLQYDEEKALNNLLDAFGSVFSLQDIASAYCEAGRNVDLATEYLCEKQESSSSVASNASKASEQKWQPLSAASSASNGEAENEKPFESGSNSPQNYCQATGARKQKWRPVSGGTISSMLGKGYVKSVPLANGSYPGSKHLKDDLKELPMSGNWGEDPKSNLVKEDGIHKDMEDFLFKMLGKGFQLDRDMIRDVLGKPNSCGYDIQKSMEKLLDRSAMNLDYENKFIGESSEKTNGIYLKADEPSQQSRKGVLRTNGRARHGEDRNYAQQAVLEALFSGAKRDDELMKRVRAERRPIALGELVEEPLIDSTAEKEVDRVRSLENNKDDEDECQFQFLRKAVKEYRGTMKEYYKAAIDAFAKGDNDQANKHLDQGQFFREKARQADEESNEKIFETSEDDAEDEMLLDLHDHGAKEAIRLLKCHLSSLAGIPSFKYLKVILESNEEDTSKGSRRRLVMKLLEKESISWSEGETSGVVLIRLDKINPKRLSFAKK